ncbi:MAG TPA: hypothetical protein VEA61_16005 [Allosphingosinicella sp.]|nr:hypothetical protein [Allosphingosinicella sp.]
MTQISLLRLYLMRAAYARIGFGIAFNFWPRVFNHSAAWPLMDGVVVCMLTALSLLALLGLRYPLQMLPVLLFELLWKFVWLSAVALPLWMSGDLDAERATSAMECLVGLILIPLIPWRYAFANYFARPGDRWRPTEGRGQPSPL